MNIFILSWIIENCAKYHCNKHVCKMILETTQLLSTAHHVTNPVQASEWTEKGFIYRKTHMNHPSAIWTRECRENYIWLCYLGLELCKEYGYRYDKPANSHACYSKLVFLLKHIPSLPSNNNVITMPKLAMPDQYKSNDPVLSYRTYYLNDKARMLVWQKRDPPPWVPPQLQTFHYQSEIKRLSTKLEKLQKRVRKTSEHLTEIVNITNELHALKLKFDSLKL